MEKKNSKFNIKTSFKLMLGVTIAAFIAIVTFIVFSFIKMDSMELYTCFVAGIGMAVLIALVTFTLWTGLKAYRE